MIRLIGAITGSALAIATLLLVIGIPQFRTETVSAERTLVRLPRPTQPVEQPRPTPEPEMPLPDAEPVEPAAVAADGKPPDATVLPSPEPVVPDDRNTGPPGTRGAAQPVAVRREETGWYAFWSPFRSRIAAEGFVDRLQSVTGLDYRIVRRKPGVYEVAFAYADDDEIGSHLSQISAATGLNLPETP